MSLLVTHVLQFIAEHVEFDEDDFDEEACRRFWSVLGVSVELLPCIVEANPVWKDAKLVVSERIKTTGCWVEKLSFLMFALFNFKKFTESRWLQQGPSNRNLSCALAVGLEQVVHITRADPTCSDYYLHGFSHCTVPVRKHAIICGLVAYVCEAVQSLLMVDDRVVRNIGQLEEALSTEMEFIHDIEMHVWERLNSIIGPWSKSGSLYTK